MNWRRDPILIAASALLLALVTVSALQVVQWLGKPFPGFLLLENRVVASAGLSQWPAVQDGAIYQQEVASFDGRPLADPRELGAYIASLPIGTEINYALRRDGAVQQRSIATARFGTRDGGLLFGSLFLCGVSLCAMALAIRFLRGRDAVATGSAAALYLVGLWSLTATDLYGPYRLFRLHALLECMLGAGVLHLALAFPQPSKLLVRWPRFPVVGYAAAGVLAIANQLWLFDPQGYVATHRLAVTAFGVALVCLIGKQAWSWVRPASFDARQRVKVVALGAVLALSPMVFLIVTATLSGGQAPENMMAFSGLLYPLSIGYAVLRSDLLEVDAFVRRSLNYMVLTAVLAVGYAGLLAGVEAFFSDAGGIARGPGFALAYSLAAVLLVFPLRDRMQSAIDRVFFRSAYDFRLLVSSTSERFASVTDRDVIVGAVTAVVAEALSPESIHLELRALDEDQVDLARLDGLLPAVAQRALAEQRAPVAVELDDGGLVVPFTVEGRRVALLFLGRRLSGAFYGGDDRRLLQTLANQAAVAIENALALEQVRELNRTLERKVEERTHELASTLDELQNTQSQLVHQEKMASLGQLVAGIAHELNNPLNFVEGNLHHLHEYMDSLTKYLEATESLLRTADPQSDAHIAAAREEHDLDYLLGDLGSLFAAMDEGVERATTIIKDLRTFSRLDSGRASEIDLAQSIDATLNLLGSRLGEIEVVRDYGDVPPLECLEGQIGQVLMNLIANAADAIESGAGRITIRTRSADAEQVAIEIEDTGVGIPADKIEAIFEPFYTTKPVGSGTGLGLAISYGIVTRHQGRIEVRSRPGEGTCFRVELPLRFRPAETSPTQTNPASGR